MKPTAIWTAALASLTLAGCAEFLRDMGEGQAAAGQPMRAGGEQVAQAPRLAVDEALVRNVQRELNAQGVDAGPVDGIWGPQTQQGIREFQQAQGMKATGHLDGATLGALGILESASAGASAQSMFERVDRNDDGAVSRAEFNARFGEGSRERSVSRQEQSASAGASGGRFDRMFERVDKNGDGAVSREEFNATLGAPRSGAGQPSGKPSFSRLDADGDGYVSLAEAGADTRISRNFNRADANGDGRLERKEFQAAAEMGASSGATQSGQDEALVKKVQQQLNAKGFDAGAVDGVMGSATRRALENFQQAQGMKASGELDRRTLSALDIQTTKED